MVILDYDTSAAERFARRTQERKKNQDWLSKNKKNKNLLTIEDQKRVDYRRSLINPNDGLAWERIIGNNDLLGINYLELGLGSSRPICRVEVRDETGLMLGYGTGFMISTILLLTNNHVLDSAERCRKSLADFNFEDDQNFLPRDVKIFSFEPDRFFYTNKDLDFTLVAVCSTAIDGTPLAKFGYVKLLEGSGKALLGEHVTIIQHPGGRTKSITLRDNRIIDIFDNFIHYESDTQGGSSGSPVFNDQWQLVALHHSGVPQLDQNGRKITKDGQLWEPSLGEDKISWIANEGIRISKIIEHLRLQQQNWTSEKKKFLNQIFVKTAEDNLTGSVITPETVVELEISNYLGKDGYDPDFLKHPVSLPNLSSHLLEDRVKLKDGDGHELKYTHFSVVMSKSRRLAFFTAVNVDGADLKKIERKGDKWYFDPRIERKYQSGPELYADNPLDRGHLVRRLDPVWGGLTIAKNANEDTFHFTNCSPQHKNLNQKTWVDLENYILENADKFDLKVNVFTGPVFRGDDMLYRGKFQIPAEFWKVVVMVKKGNKLSATAYLQTQKNLIEDLEFAYGEYRTYQVPITAIESLTNLDFGNLRDHDPIANIEGLVGRIIRGPNDIRL